VELNDDMIVARVLRNDGKEAAIYQTDKAYLVPSIITPKEKDGLRIGRSILQKEIPLEEVTRMLTEGRTNLMKGFVSNKTKRTLEAYLLLDEKTGKFGFEFPEREPRYPQKPQAPAEGETPPPPVGKKAAKKAAKKAPKKS
jgi:DNA topoisomerase-3